MMRVFWEEWRSGAAFSRRRLLPALLAGAALLLLVTQFQPGALALVLVVGALVGGTLSGTGRWNQVAARDWVGLEATAPLAYLSGKVTGLILLSLAWAVFFLPLILLVSLSWGVPWTSLAVGALWITAAALGAQAMSQVTLWGTGEFSKIMGSILVFLWAAATLQAPGLRQLNPLWQVWDHFREPSGFDLGAWAVVMGITVACWILKGLLLRVEGVK